MERTILFKLETERNTETINFHNTFPEVQRNSIIEKEPLSRTRKIGRYFDEIFEKLTENGIYRFQYDHHSKLKQAGTQQIVSMVVFPIGVLWAKQQKPLTPQKLEAILFRHGFEIENVSESGGIHTYTARKNILLTI